MVRLEHVSKSFAAIRAVDDVSLAIPPGAITILTGADGAGKSTIFKMLVGLIKKDAGAILLKGEDIDGDYSLITSICGYMPEKFSLYTDLSVEENMDFFAAVQQVPTQRREDLKQRLLKKTGMEPFRKRRAGALSGGMKQKLALSTILLSSPELIILDEPTTGVDPLSRIEFFSIIEALKDEGRTIVMSTPYLDEAEKGDYIVFIKNGRVMRQDSLASLRGSFPARLFRILPGGTSSRPCAPPRPSPVWRRPPTCAENSSSTCRRETKTSANASPTWRWSRKSPVWRICTSITRGGNEPRHPGHRRP